MLNLIKHIWKKVEKRELCGVFWEGKSSDRERVESPGNTEEYFLEGQLNLLLI